jgi:Tfp pilus assembly protein PilP
MRDALIRQAKSTTLFLAIAGGIAVLTAQSPPPPGQAPTTTATSSTGTPAATGTSVSVTDTGVQQSLQEILEEPSAAEAYHYDPQGRRDPFRSLIGPLPKLEGNRPAGVAGFLIDELHLQGIVKTKDGFIGIVSGPDNKGYLLHVRDKVLDGEVIRITPTTVVLRQEVNDPTRIERFREVVMDLNPPDKKKR